MCVHICRKGQQLKYDMNRPLAEQVDGSEEIIVNYQENDNSVHHFLDAIEEFSKNSYGYGLNIKVVHNDMIGGARAKKKVEEVSKEIIFNDIIRLMALMQYEADRKLCEIAAMCTGTKNE